MTQIPRPNVKVPKVSELTVVLTAAPVDLVASGKGKGKSPHISNVTVSVEDFGADSSFDDVEDRDEPKRIIKRRKKKQKFNCKVCDAKVYKAQKKLFTACAICGGTTFIPYFF